MARMITRRHTLMSLALLGAGGRAFAQAEQDPDPWPDLKRMFFNDASIEEDKSLVEVRGAAARRGCGARADVVLGETAGRTTRAAPSS